MKRTNGIILFQVFLTSLAMVLLMALAIMLYFFLPYHKQNMFCGKTFGGNKDDSFHSIIQANDGAFIAVGWTKSFSAGGKDAWVVKFDSRGNIIWQKTFGGEGYGNFSSIQKTNDRGFIVAGNTNCFIADASGETTIKLKGAGIVKLNENGEKIWDKTLGDASCDVASSIQQTKDGGFVFTGFACSFGSGKHDFWIIKLDESAKIVWEKVFGGSDWDVARSIEETVDGGFIVAGYTMSFGAGELDAWIIKLDEKGNKAWEKTYGGIYSEEMYSLQKDSKGYYVLAGFNSSFSLDGFDFWVIKIKENGSKVWDKSFDKNDFEMARSLTVTKDFGYIVAGITKLKEDNFDAWVVKLDEKGNKIWDKTYGGSKNDWANSIIQTGDGGYIAVGYTESFGKGGRDAWILKLDGGGNCLEFSE